MLTNRIGRDKIERFQAEERIEAYRVPLEVTWTGVGDTDKGKEEKAKNYIIERGKYREIRKQLYRGSFLYK